MAGILNRGTIVSNGLSLGGNPNLTTKANTFLNLVLDHLHRTRDLQYLLKSTTLTLAAGNYAASLSAVTDYRAVRYLELAGANGGALTQVEHVPMVQRLFRDQDNGSPRGIPTHFSVEPDSTQIRVWQIPDAAYTLRMIYYFMPTTLAADADVPLFPDHYVLVQMIAAWCASYERDSQQVLISNAAEMLWQTYKNSQKDFSRSPAQQVVQLDPGTFKKSPFNAPAGWMSFDKRGPG